MKHNINTIKGSKNHTKLTMITAYDALFAKLFNGKIDIILVGDSLNMSFLGKEDTISASLDQMIYHTQAVCNGAKDTFVVCDMPFGTYTNPEKAFINASKVYQQTQASAVKIEGGREKADVIQMLTQNSIAVMGHIGLMPQCFRSDGGYKIKGKDEDDIQSLIIDAKAVEDAGAFCMVVEGVKPNAAKLITQAVNIPVIGIGAGADTDGQVLVWSDMFGFFEDFTPKFVRKYLDGANLIKDGLDRYIQDVKNKDFPNAQESY